MRFEEAAEAIKGIPFTVPQKGRVLYDLVRNNGYRSCMELGFAHGTSSVYIASALAANGQGSLISIDNESARTRAPNLPELLIRTNLERFVTPVFHPAGYTWYLMEYLEAGGAPLDFCFIDGSHSWDVDGFAFLIIANLLRPGGTVVFDDMDWTYGTSPSLKETPHVRAMSSVIRDTPQVRKVFQLLAASDPRFECSEESGWGYARKTRS